ncbi:hypothetical protein ES319_A01G114600v1 [Gossypium barbadense]|uniref:ABC1 atypical kinase-like domain-containing protein n=3 Tax=Gossypium TaxID=3633 RepID=A0A5J5WWC7_GOSBA|nr:hypothetical protein ES319_A01G114600v1 [Gossypium barbadense]TYH30810.1 hypothetical protein ES288_A01G124100v1 [Gossypium darwinii]
MNADSNKGINDSFLRSLLFFYFIIETEEEPTNLIAGFFLRILCWNALGSLMISIFKVHQAGLRGDKIDVVVKVQHPGIQDLMMTDIRNLQAFALYIQKNVIKFDLFFGNEKIGICIHINVPYKTHLSFYEFFRLCKLRVPFYLDLDFFFLLHVVNYLSFVLSRLDMSLTF